MLMAWRHIVLLDPCAYCGRPTQSVDHVVPRSAGGNEGNLAGSCLACNNQKRDMPLLLFMCARASGRLPHEPQYVTKGQMLKRAEERKRRKALREKAQQVLVQKAARKQRDADAPMNSLREHLIKAGVIRPAKE